MGTAEGAVGQASPSRSHPVCSRPSPDPPADLTSPSVRIPPAALRPPKPEGSVHALGPGQRGKERAVWQRHLPQPLQSTDAFERASQTLLAFT